MDQYEVRAFQTAPYRAIHWIVVEVESGVVVAEAFGSDGQARAEDFIKRLVARQAGEG